MSKDKLNKIIYFDKETISNILQELNKGTKSSNTGTTTVTKGIGEIEAAGKIKLGVPLLERVSFLLSGKIALTYFVQRDKTTTITSTEISEFEELKPHFIQMKAVQVKDIENSSTFLRVAGGYLKIIKGGIENVDTREFKSVMDSYDGYDTYKVNEEEYVRFNNLAFVSNYKRNDLLATKINLYCVLIGEFERKIFDFIEQITKMDSLITGVNTTQTLADIYFPENKKPSDSELYQKDERILGESSTVALYDVVYASIPFERGEQNEK